MLTSIALRSQVTTVTAGRLLRIYRINMLLHKLLTLLTGPTGGLLIGGPFHS